MKVLSSWYNITMNKCRSKRGFSFPSLAVINGAANCGLRTLVVAFLFFSLLTRFGRPSQSASASSVQLRWLLWSDWNLGNGDFLSFWDDDAEETVLYWSLNTVLIDVHMEFESPTELSYRTLGKQVFLLGLQQLRGSTFIFDSCFVEAGYLAILSNSACSYSFFDKFNRWNMRGISTLRAAPNGHGLRVGEFDLNIVLNTWHFAMEDRKNLRAQWDHTWADCLVVTREADEVWRSEGWVRSIGK